jgi:hypothetical protein
MKDYKDTEIAFNQIVKHENFETGEINYFYVDKSNFNYMWLVHYDDNGNINKDGLFNIKVDTGINLINDKTSKWTILGTKEEVYDDIFNK